MAAAEAERPVKRLPGRADWAIMGVIETGTGLVNVRHVVKLAGAAPGEPVTGTGVVTGILSTTAGVCYVTRPWDAFLADYYTAIAAAHR
jgi:hypothetical protein